MPKTNDLSSMGAQIAHGQATLNSQTMPIILNSCTAVLANSTSRQPVRLRVDHRLEAVAGFGVGICMLAAAAYFLMDIAEPTHGVVNRCLAAFFLLLGSYLVSYSIRSPQIRYAVAGAGAGFLKIEYRYLSGVLIREARTADVASVNWIAFNEGGESDTCLLRVELRDGAAFDIAVPRTDALNLAAAIRAPLEKRAESRRWIDTSGDCPSWSKARSALGMTRK
jgi:hypothetical protein